ncbi:DUF4870 domain-containing protein [Ulvibacter antarcticus]|uniref:Tic20 family protein n=1 Tax=Ulvibacter antarcticus TaxID=442714 RepID=A0A3L9YY61_9FLAO|nr:DUF4870 domain-containing protein [Ulvibacter antarcticus]RMA64747.1 hypothetical protein BXY75_1628 [Ulvibacter antarcticus]
MENTVTENSKNLGAIIHLSTFLKFFFPFGNFIAPLIIWTMNKEKPFVDEHGRQAINFQLSVFLYTLLIGVLCIPFFVIFAADFISLIDVIEHTAHEIQFNEITNLSGYILLFGIVAMLLFGLFIFELYAVITATMHAAKGKLYKYPLSIPFIKSEASSISELNQSKNEHNS